MIINGLFGVNNGIIRDLVINSGTIRGGEVVGSVVGKNYGSIINCGNKTNVTGDGAIVGGVCGQCYAGSISGCFNSGTVTGHNGRYDESDTGGVIGSVRYGSLVCDWWCGRCFWLARK